MASNNEQKCSACGTSQVNHKLMFFLRLIDELFEKVNYLYSPFYFLDKKSRLVDFFEKFLFNLLHLIGIIRYDDDIEKVLNGRSRVVWEEAKRRGIEMQQLFFFGKRIDHFRAKINGKYYFFNSLPIPSWLAQNGYYWIDNKFNFAKRLEKANIPSPKTRKISSFKDALSAFNELSKPIIIKPKLGSLGRHTTTNINTIDGLKKAFDLAREITYSMVAQEHLFGSVYRATVVDGRLVGFFRADPPCVTGNGVHTIAELIEEKNKNKNEKVGNILINKESINFLDRQGYTIDSILESGKKINLIAKIGRFYGGYTKEMLPEVHPKFHDIFKKASGLVSVPVAGFDLIIEDATKDPDAQRWGIIECNSLPFIDLHYFALEGKPVNIASYIWDLWDKKVA